LNQKECSSPFLQCPMSSLGCGPGLAATQRRGNFLHRASFSGKPGSACASLRLRFAPAPFRQPQVCRLGPRPQTARSAAAPPKPLAGTKFHASRRHDVFNPKMRSAAVRALLIALVAFTAPAFLALAAEPGRTIDVGKILDAGQRPAVDVAPTPADPEPMMERAQWVFDLRWERGDVWLLGARSVLMQAQRVTPRAMGRFALELYEGPALIERVRFDFPMLAVPDTVDAGWASPPLLTRKMRTRIGVIFPATRRGTRLELRDRATGDRWSLPWPPGQALLPGGAS
jgi:hypothetical protein